MGGLEDVEEHEKPKRPSTAVGVFKQVKVIIIFILSAVDCRRDHERSKQAQGSVVEI